MQVFIRHSGQGGSWMYKYRIRHVVKNTLLQSKMFTISMLIAIVGAVVFALIPPLVLEILVNDLTKEKSISIQIACIYFAILAISGIFEAAKEVFVIQFGQRVTHGIRSQMCRKLSDLSASYFTLNESGAIASRFVNDVDTVEALFTNGIISMLVDVCKVVSIMGVIFVKSKGLGILLAMLVPMLYILTRFFQKRMLVAQKQNRVAIAMVNEHIPETIRNIRTIHSLVKEDYMKKRYDQKIKDSYRAVEKSNLYDSMYSPIIVMISTGLIALLMVLAASSGEMQMFFGMTVGTAVAIISYVGKIFDPIENIGMEIQNIQSAVAGIARINEFLQEKEQEVSDKSISIDTMLKEKNMGICLENVTFAYEDTENIIDDMSIQIKEGEMVTIAGRTGAGKSTILKLLLGLYQPQKGRVFVFGQEAKKIPNKEKRKLFGYVWQSFYAVPGTVADQISLFDKNISKADIENAARLVGLHQNIVELENGYDTEFKSTSFSKGQLQLLSIARAVVTNPPIMLFDEITANLDSFTEKKIYQALEKVARGRTVISISHRLYENMGSRLIMIGQEEL